MLALLNDCSPPNTVIGIETYRKKKRSTYGKIAALLIPSSVLKLVVMIGSSLDNIIAALLIPSSVLKPSFRLPRFQQSLYCSPPNTVIGIETASATVVVTLTFLLQPS